MSQPWAPGATRHFAAFAAHRVILPRRAVGASPSVQASPLNTQAGSVLGGPEPKRNRKGFLNDFWFDITPFHLDA